MPPSGFNEKAVLALAQFLEACYEDLLVKVRAKGNTSRAVEEAIDEELDELRTFLRSFTTRRVTVKSR